MSKWVVFYRSFLKSWKEEQATFNYFLCSVNNPVTTSSQGDLSIFKSSSLAICNFAPDGPVFTNKTLFFLSKPAGFYENRTLYSFTNALLIFNNQTFSLNITDNCLIKMPRKIWIYLFKLVNLRWCTWNSWNNF